MLKIRPYKSCDAETIAKWVQDKDVFMKWSGGRFGAFPVTAHTIDEKYRLFNGDCAEADNFYPWVAFDDNGEVVGHFIMRYLNGNKKLLRFGWVVADPALRGKGCGTQMLSAGLQYAFTLFGAEKVTIGVFENNAPAHRCYLKTGFTDVKTETGDPWNIIEMEIDRKSFFDPENRRTP
ncbi:MAG: GNAT family N-acetyltransferase [Clostridia bacterium]|nr:GNAT family N-acetyltransferase [Clostridia bacterium]